MKPETDAKSNFSEAQQQVANQVSEVSKKAADSFSAAKEDLTQKAKDVAAVPAGTVGAVNVCCAPFVPATGVNVIPAGAVHV